MQGVRIDHCRERERIIADNIRDVASDLRLIDVSDLVANLKTMQFANVGTLVQSSVEMWFKQNTLQFSHSGDVHLSWETQPQIFFDMEFHNLSAHVYFRLLLEAKRAGVELTFISFDDASASPETNTLRLRDAFADARAKACDGPGPQLL